MNITGIDRLREDLDHLAVQVRAACFRALQQSAEAIVADTQDKVRKASGNLHDSVRARYRNNELRAEVGWWDRDDLYASFHEFGTRKFPAQPALLPAAEAERTRLPGRIRDEVRKVL
ncbi:HK97-gp10 family putative phage morphogenesis protein [Streptomyces odonnellii]|uniref:HK97-gp10 family putative phage morphogenesis protein n=1 Tax=Streptomyces odonnellii TaxID=1417980 RepID=UPI001E5B1DFD|nr:HK97-gp10 family putative phage morphogenesis protein [Streptomyces odonnellii]